MHSITSFTLYIAGPAPGLTSSYRHTAISDFRATGIATYLQNGGIMEHVQLIAHHESPRTTKLYDRTNDASSLGEIECILI
jgi:hypothetical protein